MRFRQVTEATARTALERLNQAWQWGWGEEKSYKAMWAGEATRLWGRGEGLKVGGGINTNRGGERGSGWVHMGCVWPQGTGRWMCPVAPRGKETRWAVIVALTKRGEGPSV